MENKPNIWRIVSIVLLFLLIGVSGLFVYLYKNNQISLTSEPTEKKEKEQQIAATVELKDFVDASDIAPEPEIVLSDTKDLEIPTEKSEPATATKTTSTSKKTSDIKPVYNWVLAQDEEFKFPLQPSQKIPDDRIKEFVQFFDQAIRNMENIGEYKMQNSIISIDKFGSYHGTNETFIFQGLIAERKQQSCKIATLEENGAYTCEKPREEYILKDVQDATYPTRYTIYSKRPNEDWEVSTSETTPPLNYMPLKDVMNPKHTLGGTYGSVVKVVGAMSNPKGGTYGYGQGLDIVYIKQEIMGSSIVRYYMLNLQDSNLYRMIMYGPLQETAEYLIYKI